MSFSLKIEKNSKIFTIFTAVIVGVVFSGCLAKNAPKLSYYELGYDDSNSVNICDRRADTLVNLAYIKVQNGYENRDIIIKDGINIDKLQDAKYISSPKDMLQKALILYLNSNCHLKLSSDAKLQMGLNITEISIWPDYAFIEIVLEIKDDNRVLSNEIISIKESYKSKPINALNLALNKALQKIHSSVLEYR